MPMSFADISKSRRLAEFFVLSAPLLGAAAFGLVEHWSRWFFLVWSLVPYLLLRPPVDARWGVFLGVGVLALLQSLRPWSPDAPAILFGTADAALSLYAASGWISAALLAASACSLRDEDPGFIRRLAVSIVATALLLAAVGLVQMANGNAAIYGVRVVMSAVYPFAGFYNRNHAACFLGVGAILAMGLYLDQCPAESRVDTLAKRATLAFPVLLLWGAIWATDSRAAIAIQLLAVVLLFRPSFLLLFGVAAGTGSLAVVNSSFSQRCEIYRSTLVAVWDRWPWGWGAGVFGIAAPVYMSRAAGGNVPHAHSDWLQLVFEFGVPIGVCLLAGAWVVLVRTMVSATGMQRAFGAAVTFVLLHAAVECPLFAGVNLAVLALCFASFPTLGFRLPEWTRIVVFAVGSYVLVASSPAALDSFHRLTTAAYFAKDQVADDLIGKTSGRELLSRYSDPARGVWNPWRQAIRARALFDLGRGRDAEGEVLRKNALLGKP
ncbi:MAG: O-antigen ligase family protein [Elusimicrobia bacterium]|nr:O-antigen ligase family protein [Elusimicrobiota bacterium]